jgi:hypothetical protein
MFATITCYEISEAALAVSLQKCRLMALFEPWFFHDGISLTLCFVSLMVRKVLMVNW